MAPSRRKGGGKAAAIAAACRQWKVGDLVLAKVKGFPAWPATVSEPEKWGYSADSKKVLVHFFGTQQIAFCNPADVEAFTEEKKQSLLTKRHAKGSDFVRAVKEITESYEKLKQQEQASDPKAAEEVTHGSAGNTIPWQQVSEKKSGIRLDTEMMSDPSHGRDESTLLSEDASAAEQMLALHDNCLPHNKSCDSAVVKEPRKIATYTSRRRNEGVQFQKGAPQKRLCSVQHSKNSSRLESDKLQSSELQYNDGGQDIDDLEDKELRRKRTRRSPGHSESGDVTSLALDSHGSDEDNASEIATVESGNNIKNESNGVDSRSKVEHSDTCGKLVEGDYAPNKGLNFQIDTLVKRKKRKPTRKRGTRDVIDPPAKVEAEGCLGAGSSDIIQTSQCSHERFNEKPCEENGDEHLPLVKRARVRMSRAFFSDREANVSPQVEERSFKDTLISATAQTSPSVDIDNDIVSSHDMSVAEESKNTEVSAKLSGDMVNAVSSPVEKPSDRMPLSDAFVQTLGDKENALVFRFNELPDDEAGRDQSNQVSFSPAHETKSASFPEIYQACSGYSQPVEPPTSQSDLPVVKCLHQIVQIESPLEPKTLRSSVHKVSEICSSGIPAQSSGQYISQQSSCDSLGNSHNSLNKKCDKNDAYEAWAVRSQAMEHSPSSCLMMNKQEAENMQEAEITALKEEQDNNKPTQTTQIPVLSASERDMRAEECEPPSAMGYSNSMDAVESSRQLELLGDAEDQKQQVKTTNSVSVSENLSREKMSLSPANIADTPAGGTPQSNSVYHTSTAESANDMQNNSSCSPNVQSGEKKTMCDNIFKEDEKVETGICQGQKVVSSDVQSTHESFENALGSLVRTKESIGRATRLAMDLMKLGVSAKAMEILALTLESESNLQRRVDLFFLVDSIAQCSKGLKGDAGGIYLSAIQVFLPRLLAAAVPAGATTQENRRQCLKVLRLWLERRILPESIVRHHIRELDSHSVVPACLYSRRSARTERSLDDPVRDMEGMLVDEYGSNSTLQLPGFCLPATLMNEDGGSDSDGGDFEPVTPEHESRILEEHVSTSTAERHTLILEDVDGDLEMEDVAPPWKTGSCTYSDQAGIAETTNCQLGQHHQLVSGMSTKHLSSSSPPLSSFSSSPQPLEPAAPSHQAHCAMSDSYSNGFDSAGHLSMHGDYQAGSSGMNLPVPCKAMHLESSYSSREALTNSMAPPDGSNFQQRPYPSHPHPPPHPPPQHQNSYTKLGHHMKLRRDVPSYSHRSHYIPNLEERNFHDNHERMRHAPYENRDNWRYPPSSSYGSRYHDKQKGTYPSSSHNDPSCDSGRFQNHRWNQPPRPHNDRHSFHHKSQSEGSVPVGMRDPGLWHQGGE